MLINIKRHLNRGEREFKPPIPVPKSWEWFFLSSFSFLSREWVIQVGNELCTKFGTKIYVICTLYIFGIQTENTRNSINDVASPSGEAKNIFAYLKLVICIPKIDVCILSKFRDSVSMSPLIGFNLDFWEINFHL